MQKSKILAFLLALVVSIVLWFYAVTVVNPDDTITISGISVQFEGTEALTSQGLMLTGGDSTKVSIKVSGRRSDLKELNNETVTAIADVTRIAASGSYQLSWSVVWPSTVATGDISETSRAPSRISVTVSDIKENPEVPIELEYTGEPKTGYMIDKSNLTLGTQSISVRGPAEEVNKIARAVVRVDVTDADALIDTDCPVVLLDKDGNELSLSQYVTSSADSVRVTIPILQYKDIKLNATLVSGGGAGVSAAARAAACGLPCGAVPRRCLDGCARCGGLCRRSDPGPALEPPSVPQTDGVPHHGQGGLACSAMCCRGATASPKRRRCATMRPTAACAAR